MTADVDSATLSNYRTTIIRSTNLEWKVDMAAKTISGLADHIVEMLANSDNIVLDARELSVKKVEWNGSEVKFDYSQVSDALGDRLTIKLPTTAKKGQKGNVRVHYSTSPSARALQFMTPEQTADGKAPFLYSQCQAIHARSIIPCQDTPTVKAPYTATVRVPSGLTCLMSAVASYKEVAGDETIFHFKQENPVPSYLVAIVVGFLHSRDIGPRSAVWAEPSVVEAAATEFSETEQFLAAAEEIAGPYIWKRYDLVVLPPSFPYGGMENPCLTFVTPTIIAGDKSQASVVAHEIAHSWTGNLVTNCNWDHFWLNEGFTVYLERLIVGKVYGSNRRWFDAEHGFQVVLRDALPKLPKEHTPLRLHLGGIDPDDAFSCVPYEKGSALLLYLEQFIFNEEETKNFIRKHVEKHATTPLDTETWLAAMKESYPRIKEIEDTVKQWLYEEGMPPKAPVFVDRSLAEQCDGAAAKILVGALNLENWGRLNSVQKEYVLSLLKEKVPLGADTLQLLSTPPFGISSSGNCEILAAWLQLGLLSHWEPCIPSALSFAKKYGRLKYCKKTYEELLRWEVSRAAAVAQFKEERAKMHPVSVQQVESLIAKYCPPS